MRFDASDLGFQRFYAGLQLLDRHRIEVLLCKLDQWVAGLARKKFFEVHC